MVQSACFYHFLVKFESISKIERWKKKRKSPFLKVHDQLQTDGIFKRFEAQRRDCAQILDFSKKIKMLINFIYLS